MLLYHKDLQFVHLSFLLRIFWTNRPSYFLQVEGKTIDVEVEESVDQLELIVEASELADINNTKVDTQIHRTIAELYWKIIYTIVGEESY